MTVMLLLQRSTTPQLTHSQKTPENNNSNQPPFLILLDIQEHAELENVTSNFCNRPANNNNNTNNIVTSSSAGHKINHESLSLIKRSSTRGSGGPSGKAGGGWSGGGRGKCGVTEPGSLAMRYYQLWIYACNIVLLVSAAGFVAAVSRSLLFSRDPRRYLVPGVPRANDLTALYAYLALAIQLGLVQLLGCIAARRLSAKLLNAYWFLIFALLFGDIVVGVAWIFRFDKMRTELKPSLRLKLQVEYNKETRFSDQWDQLQREFACCGVTGPLDFGSDWPVSCCPSGSRSSLRPRFSLTSSSTDLLSTPSLEVELVVTSASINTSSPVTNETAIEACPNPHIQGCEGTLENWMVKTADLLFVLGFCVIAFTKCCFLGILRYEIREMIQKIRLLKKPLPLGVPFIQSFCPAQPSQSLNASQNQQQLVEVPVNNGNISRRTTLPIVTSSGTTSLLGQGDEYSNGKHPLLGGQDVGAESDTNSHCALILEESTPPAQHHASVVSRARQHQQHLQQLQPDKSSNATMEMREFNRRLLFNGTSVSLPGFGSSTSPGTANSQLQQQQQQQQQIKHI